MTAIGIVKIHDLQAGRVPRQGTEVLVDRLWPRGVKKAAVHLAAWLPQVAPSAGLREWFSHDPARFAEFAERYRSELDDRESQLAAGIHTEQTRELDELISLARAATQDDPLMLVYAAHDREHNQAVVLADWLRAKLR